MNQPNSPQMDEQAALEKARRSRNLWLGLALGVFVILVLLVTIVRLSTGVGISERM